MFLSRRRWEMRCSRQSAHLAGLLRTQAWRISSLVPRKQPEFACQGLQPASPDLGHRHSVGFRDAMFGVVGGAGGALLAAKHPVTGLLRMQA